MTAREPTKDEARNGWTRESLAAYEAERTAAQTGIVMFDPDFRRPPRPTVANGKYSPLRPWR